MVAVDSMWREERDLGKELRDRKRLMQRQENKARIKGAKYNKRFEKVWVEQGVPRYLSKERTVEGRKGKWS